jgi:hypothetical protein
MRFDVEQEIYRREACIWNLVVLVVENQFMLPPNKRTSVRTRISNDPADRDPFLMIEGRGI